MSVTPIYGAAPAEERVQPGAPVFLLFFFEWGGVLLWDLKHFKTAKLCVSQDFM